MLFVEPQSTTKFMFESSIVTLNSFSSASFKLSKRIVSDSFKKHYRQ